MSVPGDAAVWTGFRPRFLEGIGSRELKLILGTGARLQFSAKSVAINQGESASRLFLLTEGSARYFYITPDGRKILLPWILPGEIFGAVAFFMQRASTYLVSTEILRDSWVLAWERTKIRNLAGRYPRLLENALSVASHYLNWALTAHIGLASHSARLRLAQTLVDLARAIGHKTPGGVELHVTNEEFANAANVTLFTESRLMSEWHRDGVLVKHYKKVLLRSPELLFSHKV
jgi:CRP/FNR family transcriptional regulator, nitrogen oxide reductase regulator